MQLSRTWERCDTQAAAATAKQLPTLIDKLTSESRSQFGESQGLPSISSLELCHFKRALNLCELLLMQYKIQSHDSLS